MIENHENDSRTPDSRLQWSSGLDPGPRLCIPLRNWPPNHHITGALFVSILCFTHRMKWHVRSPSAFLHIPPDSIDCVASDQTKVVPSKYCPVDTPGSKVHGAIMGPIWALSVPDGPHVGTINLAIRDTLATAAQKSQTLFQPHKIMVLYKVEGDLMCWIDTEDHNFHYS